MYTIVHTAEEVRQVEGSGVRWGDGSGECEFVRDVRLQRTVDLVAFSCRVYINCPFVMTTPAAAAAAAAAKLLYQLRSKSVVSMAWRWTWRGCSST
eukprot:scaffold6162_cov59-Phaeocystis_antarctica.AAC.2